MTTTPNLALTLIETSQAQKEITANLAFSRLDAMLNSSAIDKDLATPPASPAAGDLYIIAASPTGDWSGKAGQVTYYNQGWNFIIPKNGLRLYVADEARFYLYNGSSWVAESSKIFHAKTVGNSGASLTIDCSAGEVHDITLNAATVTLSFSNPPASGKPMNLFLYLRQDASGSRVVSWPASVKWAGGSAPTLTTSANKLDIIELHSADGGANWRGRVYGLNYI